MGFSIETEGSITSLVYTVEGEQGIDKTSLGMVQNNKIKDIIPIVYTQMDDVKQFRYNITSKLALNELIKTPISKRKLTNILMSICENFIAVNEFMIDDKSLVLDFRYIYIDVSTYKASLICLPLFEEENSNITFSLFVKSVIMSIQADTSEDLGYIGEIINYTSTHEGSNFSEFKALFEKIDKDYLKNKNQVNTAVQTPFAPPVFNNQANEQTPFTPPMFNNQANEQTSFAPPVFNNQINEQPPVPNFQIPNGTDAKPVKEKKSWFGGNKEPKAPKPPKAPKAPKQPKASKKGNAQNVAVPSFVPNSDNTQFPQFNQEPQFQVPQFNQEQPVQAPQFQPDQAFQIPQFNPDQPIQTPQFQQEPQFQQAPAGGFGETVVLQSFVPNETTVLSGELINTSLQAYVIRTKTQEKTNVNKAVFRIGKEKSFVDLFVGDNTAVSRSHADIITRENKYYIKDMNSTNHTYVDDQVIGSGVEVEIKNGTRLKLANEEFTFVLA